MNSTTTENASSQQIVVAYTKLFTDSSHWLISQLVEIKPESFKIDDLAETIKNYCCGQDEFSNLCLNLNDSLSRISQNELSQTDEEAVNNFRRRLYLAQIDLENQELLQEIWDKLQFPMNVEDVASLSYTIRWIGQRVDSETIKKEGGKLVIKPQDNYELAYAPSYLKELLKSLHKISNVSVNWNDNEVDRTENLQVYWNQATGKVQLMRSIL